MIIETKKMIPVTKLQRELTQRIREVSETGGPLYILKNNEMTAVIVSAKEYELLRQSEEILERLEIAETVEKRLKNYDRTKNVSWDKVKKKHGA